MNTNMTGLCRCALDESGLSNLEGLNLTHISETYHEIIVIF